MPGFWLPEQELSTRVVTLPRLKVTLCSDRMDLKVQAERSTDVTWNHLCSRERQNQIWGRRERFVAQGDGRISSCPVALLDYSRACKVTLYLDKKSHFNTFWHFLELMRWSSSWHKSLRFKVIFHTKDKMLLSLTLMSFPFSFSKPFSFRFYGTQNRIVIL